MNITGVGSRSSLVVQSLVDMRRQLDDLQRQLGTGQRADTYAGVGPDRGFAVGLRAHVAALDAYGDSIKTVGVRMDLAQSTLGRVGDIARSVKLAAVQSSLVQNDGSTIAQSGANFGLEEILGLLNGRAGDRYLFSGLAADQPSVATFDHIMNGDGARAGFKQILAERKLADLGATGLGRLDITAPTLTSVAVTEDAISPFGFKLAGVSTTLAGAILTGPSGLPAAVSVDLPANPNAGENLKLDFNLPDGTSESITLVATASATPGPNEFTIGATSDVTAANLQAALTAVVDKLAETSLTAASAIVAGADFFGNPPQRVVGPPFDTATTQAAGTAADTVFWYTGEDGPDPARSTATARIDASLSVPYGLRANEQGIRWVVQNMATLAAVTFTPSDPNDPAATAALGSRIANNLAVPAGTQKVEDIQIELAGGQSLIAAATERHQQTKSTLSDMLQEIEGVSPEEVATQILALQTRLQASLQTTSLLYQTTLLNYI